MAQANYIAWSGATGVLTAAIAGVSISTTLKTVQQIQAPANCAIAIKEYGYVFLGSALPTVPITLELIDTGSIAATVTAGNVHNWNAPNGAASQVQIGTSGTGYTSTNEGTITATRLLALRAYPADWAMQYPLADEPAVAAGKILRVRATCGAGTASIATYVRWVEGA